MESFHPEPALFSYIVSQEDFVPWKAWASCQDAIIAAFQFSPTAGILNIGLPWGIDLPLCGNPSFRDFAANLFVEAPGLPIFVLGGNSSLSRELLLASLPNLQAATDGTGTISVTYPSIEAQVFLHNQFAAMLHAGIDEKAAIMELTLLSRQTGMEESHWA